MTMIFAAILAIACLGVAVTGFASLGDIEDAARLSDAKGFAWFWAFLASVAIVVGVLAWWLTSTQGQDEDA
jgi:hypothetical protein